MPGLRVPYCHPCALHVTAWQSAHRAEPPHPARRFGWLVAFALSACAAAWLAVAAAWAWSIAALAVTALAAINYGHLSRVDAETRAGRDAARERWARNAVGPAYCGPGPAVRYGGHHGDAHALEFDRADYAATFVDANAAEVVGMSGPGMR